MNLEGSGQAPQTLPMSPPYACAHRRVISDCVSEEGLRSLGFQLEVRIGNDAPTFNTAHLAGLVFLFRDAVGDQATMCTGARRAH